jgi:hypothetical protein
VTAGQTYIQELSYSIYVLQTGIYIISAGMLHALDKDYHHFLHDKEEDTPPKKGILQ